MLIFQKRPFHSIRAIIFDMDGTLIDSVDAYHGILKDVMERLGMELTFSREVIFETFSQGKKLSDIIFPPDLENRGRIVEQFRALAMNAFKETFTRGKVELIDGVIRLLDELRERGFSLAIVTSSMTEVVVPFLKARNLHSYLKCVLGRTEVPQLKPSPDPLLKCMEILNVEPHETVYVGDSAIDIQAGKAAGVWTVGVLTGTSDLNRLKAEAPDAILHSAEDLLTIL
jgi:HAD superfamily hydrolase (TIGR01662 family)